MNECIFIFNEQAEKYDRWFESYPQVFESELNALKRFLPEEVPFSLEVGAGTGRFASHLGIKIGVEPAVRMAQMAKKRKVEVIVAVAESLPFSDLSFELVLLNTVLCFLNDPETAIKEAKRVLKPKGKLLIGMIDKNSFLARLYESKESGFYKFARFYPVSQVLFWLKKFGFSDIEVCQTIFKTPDKIKSVEPSVEGWGRGGFVVICATI